MPITARIHPDGPVRIVRFDGVIDEDMLLDAFRALWTAPDYDPALPELDDLSGATAMPVSSLAIRRLAGMAVETHAGAPGSRVAIFAPSDLAFGLSRMYTVFTQELPDQYRVFRGWDEACAWVGLPRNGATLGEP